jgi:hypothetical protein
MAMMNQKITNPKREILELDSSVAADNLLFASEDSRRLGDLWNHLASEKPMKISRKPLLEARMVLTVGTVLGI